MEKTLVYHFFVSNDMFFEGTDRNIIYKIHLFWLKKFCKVFDKAIFVISYDSGSYGDLINVLKGSIIKMGFDDIRFITEPTDGYREARTFYNEIIVEMDKLNGLVFFGHSKGFTNELNDSLFIWISLLYSISLIDVPYTEETFKKCRDLLLYGSLLKFFDGENDARYKRLYYDGSFYWITMDNLKHQIEISNAVIPNFANRFYAEEFPMFLSKSIYAGTIDHYVLKENNLNMYENANLFPNLPDIIFREHNDMKDKYFDYLRECIESVGYKPKNITFLKHG